MNWYVAVLKKYAVFEGRAARTEYWMFVLFNLIVSVVLSIVDRMIGIHALGVLYSLAVLLPSIGVGIRRLHDTDRSGWWLLIALVPFVGWIVLLYFVVQDSTPGDNQYGPSVKGGPAPAAAMP
jgi:uncharacterized membrane protein YhaH (DUF805 family)